MNKNWYKPIQQWLEYANQDLLAAREIANRDDLHPRIACFLSQQSAEKSLKAILTMNNIPFRKMHDLEQLLAEAPEEVYSSLGYLDISWLTNWVITGRYPGDWPEATTEDATRAIEIAEEVYRFTKSCYLEAINNVD